MTFPDHQYIPRKRLQLLLNSVVTPEIGVQLVIPKLYISRWAFGGPTIFMLMPEATVN